MPYYKLEKWDSRSLCFINGARAYPSGKEAHADATDPGRYRVTHVDDDGRRTALEPFDVAGSPPKPRQSVKVGGIANRPTFRR